MLLTHQPGINKECWNKIKENPTANFTSKYLQILKGLKKPKMYVCYIFYKCIRRIEPKWEYYKTTDREVASLTQSKW